MSANVTLLVALPAALVTGTTLVPTAFALGRSVILVLAMSLRQVVGNVIG
jgi:hypothetical protein